ncbi:MAG: hypothetical protein H3C31_04880 [Brumimicrobium sp.]|nr:hypothetical protein [Brumimicrobium sp.]MCO5269858.1 hypothetical protein [Brumimicrobium sp.]
MKEKLKIYADFALVSLLLISAIFIIIYYLLAKTIIELRDLPPSFLIAIVCYIGAQLLKQLLHKKRPWYNWLYYLGLIAIVIPLPLFSAQGDWLLTLVRFGSIFLLLPPMIELFILSREVSQLKNRQGLEKED